MYKKAFELSYKNKKVEIEIQDFVGDVRNINGTEDLFSLSYISDSKDKGQSILVTEADINFYADDYFNIDELKTVGETDIKVKYYEDGALLWSGFVIPDFFSTSVDITPVVSMVATDRVGTLKEISNNAESNIPIQILASCLKQTGQDLPINLIADNNHFETPIQLERIEDIASYDVIRTFMVLFNCKITLYKNAWWIINKKLLESGFVDYKSYNSDGAGGSVTPFAQPILDIDLVDRDGQREIKPTASEISLFLEFGGSKKYPNNWNFEKWNGTTFDNWTNYNGFSQGKRQTEIIFYTRIDGYYQAYLSEIETENKSLWYVARWYSNKLSDNILDYPNLKSSSVNIPKERGFIDIALNGNFTTRDGMPIWIVPLIHNKTNGNYFTYNKEGVILKIGSGTPNLNQSNFDYVHNPRASSQAGFNPDDFTHEVVDVNWDIKNTFDLRDFGSDSDEIEMQVVFLGGIYLEGSLDYGTDVFLNAINISFNDSQVTGKGLIFKIKQGGEKFSKSREPETILFSDKINQGVNGYFYNYKYDDTSIVDLPSEFALSSVRERADMFSKARDYYSLDGNFIVNPLAKYTCGLKSFVLIGGQNRREDAGIIVEEIVSNTLNKTDFIYTYFDDGKDKVKTIGTASGGSSSGGGGGSSPSTPQLIKVDDEGNYYSEQPFYSLGGLSAYGFSEVGDGDGDGGGIVDLSNYYTKVEVDSLIDNIEVGDVDLTNYYTKVEVDSLIDNIEVGDVDLTNYYTKVEVDSLIPDLSNYYTKVETYSKTEVDNLINGVGVGGGGGLIKEDENGNYYSQKNFYSLGGLSAFGFSDEGSGTGGGVVNILSSWANYTSDKSGWALSAGLGVDLNTRKADKTWVESLLEDYVPTDTKYTAGRGLTLTGTQFSTSFDIANYATVTALGGKVDKKTGFSLVADTEIARLANVTNQDISGKADKSTTLSGYGITDAYTKTNVDALLSGKENAFTKNSAFNKNFGTTVGTVAEGDHSHPFYVQGGSINRISRAAGTSVTELWQAGFYGAYKTPDFISQGDGGFVLIPTWNYTNQSSRYMIQLGGTVGSTLSYRSTNIDGIGSWRNIWDSSNHRSNSENDTRYKEPFDAFKTTFDTMFRKTATNEIEAKLSLYTLGGLSAYGFSDEGASGGGGGIVNILSDWAIYDASKEGWALGAGLGKGLYDNKADKTDPRFTDARTPLAHTHVISDITGLQTALNSKTNQTFSDGLNTRLTSIEGGSATTVNVSGTGDLLASVSKIGNNINFIKGNQSWNNLSGKPSTFVPSAHSHPISDITNLQTTLNNKLETLIFNTHNNDNIRHITGTERTKWNKVVGDFAGLEIGGRNYFSVINGNTSARKTIQLEPNTQYVLSADLPLRPDGGRYLFVGLPDFIHISTINGVSKGVSRVVTTGTDGVLEFHFSNWDVNWLEDGVYHVKLEKGTIPTDWTPAPEDQVSDWNTTDVNSFSFIKNKPTTLSGYGITDAYTKSYIDNSLNLKLNKLTFDDLFEKVETSAGKWAVKVKYNLFSVGEISAFGASESEGGGGGSMNMMQTWSTSVETENYYLPAKLAVPFYDDTRSRLSTLEGGSATTVNTSGTGDLLASVSKVGNNINFIKGNQSWGNLTGKPSTFAPSAHSHPISDITNLQTTLNSKLATSIFNTHNTDNTRHITGVERTKWDGVATDFGNLEIGGRNLLMLNPIFWQRGAISSATGVLGSSTTRLANITGNEIGGAVPYIVEFYSPHNIFLFFYDENDNYLGSNGWLTERTFGVTPAGTKKVKFGVAKSDNSTIVVDDILDVKIKIEKGTFPTDWTPAPEDQVSDWNTTDVNSFSFIKNKPTSLSQFTDNIGVATHIANKANPHNVTTAQIGAVDLTTNQTIGGVKSFTSNAKFTTIEATGTLTALGGNSTNWNKVYGDFNEMFRKVGTNIEAKLPLYSLGGLSAYGFSDEGTSSGGGIVNILSEWTNYDTSKSGWALSAGLGENLRTRVVTLENAEIDLSGYATLNYVNDKVKTNVPLNAKFTDTIVDISGKVDKKTGFSLISDTEITRLSSVTNQDLSSYAKTSDVNTLLLNKVDKVAGKSLISDTEITRLSSVTNQDLTPYALKTYVDTEVGKKWAYNETTIKAVKVSNAVRADNVGGFTVGVNVPANAKFTDTIVDISGKVDKVAGKSLISDSEITRLSSVTNQDISGKVDKVSGKGLSTNDFTTVEKNKLAILENQTRESLGIENVTNESKLTMFTNPTFTGTTKVTILELNTNWKFVKVGNNIELQYNGVTKQIMTNNGDIIATAGVTAYQ